MTCCRLEASAVLLWARVGLLVSVTFGLMCQFHFTCETISACEDLLERLPAFVELFV